MAPVLANRTRDQLIQAVGYHLPDFFVGSTTSAGGDATSVLDTKLRGGNDAHNGKWVRFTSGTLDGEVSRVDDYVQSTGDITVAPAFSATVPSGASYELWPADFQPARIAEFINQAILDTYGRAYNPVESLALHADGKTLRYDVPSGLSALSRIYARESVTSVQIDACDSGWTQQSNVTQAFDATQKKQGSASVRLVVAAAAGTDADLGLKTITALDISEYDTLECWIRPSVAVAASALKLGVAPAGTDSLTWTLRHSIPALTANVWAYVRLAVNPNDARQNTGITTIALYHAVDVGAFTVWLDDIKAVVNDGAVWRPVSRRAWDLDKDTGDLVFTEEGMQDIGYSLLKLVGGDAPLLLTTDSDVNEVDDLFVVYRATELAFRSRAMDKSEYGQQAFSFGQMAQARRRHLHRLRGSRKVS